MINLAVLLFATVVAINELGLARGLGMIAVVWLLSPCRYEK